MFLFSGSGCRGVTVWTGMWVVWQLRERDISMPGANPSDQSQESGSEIGLGGISSMQLKGAASVAFCGFEKFPNMAKLIIVDCLCRGDV
jgi:hypothetical protein